MQLRNTKLKDFYAQKTHRAYSRIPIYRENPDFITGYVLKQNVLEELAEDQFDKQLSEIRRPILAYDEDQSVADVWEDMLKKKEQIAQVQNSFGCFLGIVTMEDIIETIIGQEIVDENDTVEDMQAYALEQWKQHVKCSLDDSKEKEHQVMIIAKPAYVVVASKPGQAFCGFRSRWPRIAA